MDEEQITVAFLDVGQGDSTVILLPDGASAVVVDCPESGQEVTFEYLRQHHITTLYVFISHSDIDHIGGVANLVDLFPNVNLLVYRIEALGVATDPDDQRRRNIILRRIGQSMQRRAIDGYCPRAGTSAPIRGLTIDVLHPDDRDVMMTGPSGDKNNLSTILRATFAQTRILMTGDVEGKGWEWVIGRGTDISADILKFPHHGAWISSTTTQPSLEDILRLISPKLVVLSLGTHNIHDHPKAQTLKLLRDLTRVRFMCTEATAKCHPSLASLRPHPSPCAGTVEVTIDRHGFSIQPDAIRHAAIIGGWKTPQCKRKRSPRSFVRH